MDLTPLVFSFHVHMQNLMIFEIGLCATKCLHGYSDWFHEIVHQCLDGNSSSGSKLHLRLTHVSMSCWTISWILSHGTAQAGALRYGHLLQCLPIKPAAPCQHLAWCAVAGGIGQSGWIGVVGPRSRRPTVFSRSDRSPKCQQSCNTSLCIYGVSWRVYCLGPQKMIAIKANSG